MRYDLGVRSGTQALLRLGQHVLRAAVYRVVLRDERTVRSFGTL
jgi:hypothetical protein